MIGLSYCILSITDLGIELIQNCIMTDFRETLHTILYGDKSADLHPYFEEFKACFGLFNTIKFST